MQKPSATHTNTTTDITLSNTILEILFIRWAPLPFLFLIFCRKNYLPIRGGSPLPQKIFWKKGQKDYQEGVEMDQKGFKWANMVYKVFLSQKHLFWSTKK